MAGYYKHFFIQAISQIELRQLRYFAAVARCGNFSKAAEELFVTQPLLSQQVAGLEAALGTKLFERNTRATVLTPVGQVLYAEVQRILDKTSCITETTHRTQENWGTPVQLDIICDELFDRSLVLENIQSFVQLNKNQCCTIKNESFLSSMGFLLTGQADCVFTFFSCHDELPKMENINIKFIADDYMDMVVSPEIAALNDWDRVLEAVRSMPLITRECDSRLLDMSLTLCENMGITPTPLFFLNVEDMLVNTAIGEGFSILPRNIARARSASTIPLFGNKKYADAQLRYVACWPKEKDPYIRQLIYGNQAAALQEEIL